MSPAARPEGARAAAVAEQLERRAKAWEAAEERASIADRRRNLTSASSDRSAEALSGRMGLLEDDMAQMLTSRLEEFRLFQAAVGEIHARALNQEATIASLNSSFLNLCSDVLAGETQTIARRISKVSDASFSPAEQALRAQLEGRPLRPSQ